MSFATLNLEPAKLVALTESLMAVHVGYGLGAKVDPLSLQAGQFTTVDCSGFVKWALFHALGQTLPQGFPDGSVQQHEWVKTNGYKPSDVAFGGNDDGIVRIAFLSPESTHEGIGHVVLLPGDGLTCESHGGKGPDRRPWSGQGWQCLTDVYCLTLPD